MSIASRINEMTEHLRNDWNSINKLGLKAKKLPDEYRQVEYIESSGTQYIDTGVNADNKLNIKYTIEKTVSGNLIFGAIYNDNGSYIRYHAGINSDKYSFFILNNSAFTTINDDTNVKHEFYIKSTDRTISVDGVTYEISEATSTDTGLNFWLFRRNSNVTNLMNYSKLKLYSCQMYYNNELVRDFVPCYRINDEEVGLYDIVNDVFYTNQGTGVFTYGETQEEIPNKNIKNIAPVLDRFYNESSDKTDLSENGVVGRTSQNTAVLPSEYTQVDYIESSGTQYINTGHYPSSNNDELEIQTSYVGGNTTSCLFGAYANDSFYQLNKTTTANQFRIITRTGDVFYTFEDYASKHAYLLESNKLYIDNTEVATGSGTVDFSSQTLYLFARNYSGEAGQFGSWRIYSCKIKTNDILVQDFIPCYRNSDNEVGLYDIVNDVFYTNQGTGVFTYGSVVSIPNPDYPQPINNLSGDVTYKVSGKNLLNLNLNKNVSRNGITYNVASDGTITINGTATAQTDIDYLNEALKTTANKKYYLEYIYISGSLTGTMNIFNQDSLHGWSGYNIDFSGADASQNRTNGKTYTTDMNMAGAKIIRISNGATLNNLKFKLQFTQSESVDYDYEPYISESFPLSLKSKNLFDKDNANVISAYISASGKISEMAVDKLIYIPCKPNTTYSLQKMPQETTNYNRFRIGTTTDTPALRMTVEDYFNAGDGSTLTNKTITTGANANYLVFYCYREDPLTTFEDMLSSIQIEEGSTATTYEPYYDINLCNISNYKDRIYSQNGKFYLEKKNGKVVLDGSENVSRVLTYTSGTYRFSITGPTDMKKNVDVALIPAGLVISNKFVEISNSDSYNIVSINGILIRMNNTNSFIINCIETQTYTAEQFKTWLSTHNTEVQYVLATPTTTEITEENYPTLYSQLLAIQEFLTKYKINKEFLLDYSSPEIEY